MPSGICLLILLIRFGDSVSCRVIPVWQEGGGGGSTLAKHLVTIWVLKHPWWPLGPCSPGHGHPESPEIAIV